MDGTTALAVLGLAPGASALQIKAAFRARVKHVHPDHLGAPDEFLALRRAYEAALAGAPDPGAEPDRSERAGDGTTLDTNPGPVPLDGPPVAGTPDADGPELAAAPLPRRRPGRWLVDLTSSTPTVDVLDVARPAAPRPAGAGRPAPSFAAALADALAG